MEALCLPVRALARRASEGSGLERTETLPVELAVGKCEVGGLGWVVYALVKVFEVKPGDV